MPPSPAIATASPQPGPQTEFLRTPADICIYGGAAGGGKTVGLILEPLRFVSRVPGFTAVFFRRTTPQITNPGGLWDESQNFYTRFGGTPHLRAHEWRWRRGGGVCRAARRRIGRGRRASGVRRSTVLRHRAGAVFDPP